MAVDWSELLRHGEGVKVEFKRRCPKLSRLARTFSAFSNSSGGTIFFGVSDDGEILGLDHLAGTRELVEQVGQFHCDPPLSPETVEWQPLKGISVLVVSVAEADVKPVCAVDPHRPGDAWPYFRSDRENLPLDRKSLKTMRRIPNRPIADAVDALDHIETGILDLLDDNPRQTLGHIARSLNISTKRAKRVLVQLEKNGWVHAFFNEKRREFALAVVWKRK